MSGLGTKDSGFTLYTTELVNHANELKTKVDTTSDVEGAEALLRQIVTEAAEMLILCGQADVHLPQRG